MFFWLLTGLTIGMTLGRAYGWAKYHYPEFQEEIKLKTARLRMQRLMIEAREEEIRSSIDQSLDKRINGGARL